MRLSPKLGFAPRFLCCVAPSRSCSSTAGTAAVPKCHLGTRRHEDWRAGYRFGFTTDFAALLSFFCLAEALAFACFCAACLFLVFGDLSPMSVLSQNSAESPMKPTIASDKDALQSRYLVRFGAATWRDGRCPVPMFAAAIENRRVLLGTPQRASLHLTSLGSEDDIPAYEIEEHGKGEEGNHRE